MTEFIKAGIDQDVIRLLRKLGKEYPIASLLLDMENKHITPLKVFENGFFVGILVTRAVRNRRGLTELVCNHVIAEDNIDVAFSDILGRTLPQEAAKSGFDILRIHTGRAGISKMLIKWGGEVKEYIFEKDLTQWKIQEIAKHHQHSKQAHPPQTQE